MKKFGGGWNEDYLAVDNSICLRGLMSVIMVLIHCRARIELLNDTVVGSLFTASGYLIVGVFFFLTGYGLRESAQNKQGYRKLFFQHRVIPYYVDCVCFLLVYIAYRLITGQIMSVLGIINSLTIGGTYIANGWYLQTALIVYIGFGLVYIIKRKIPTLNESIALLTLFLIYYIYLLSCANMLCAQSIVGLLFGYCWSENKEFIYPLLKAKFGCWVSGAFVIFALTLVVGNWYSAGVMQILIKAVSVVCFIIWYLLSLMIVPIKCKILHSLGSVSLELYALHGLWINIFDKEILRISDMGLYIAEVLLCSMISAYIMHMVIKWINALLHKCFA